MFKSQPQTTHGVSCFNVDIGQWSQGVRSRLSVQLVAVAVAPHYLEMVTETPQWSLHWYLLLRESTQEHNCRKSLETFQYCHHQPLLVSDDLCGISCLSHPPAVFGMLLVLRSEQFFLVATCLQHQNSS